MSPNPESIDWQAAPAHILDRLAGLASPHPVLGITGPAGAGKSTLASIIAESTHGLVLSTDDYLPDYEGLPVRERDLPEHADLPLLNRHLQQLRKGRPADIPTWSFHEHRRTGTRPIGPATGPIVLEGLFALHTLVRESLNLAVYVDAPPATRWQRWEAIEQRGERGMGVEAARAFFHDVADPTFARFAADYRASADLIVTNEE
ncbi:MAG: AAA family ATPase [Phycisphaeraceae bacterium]|nr:MAG: AAA family ATPase [Phycisphaeraceae bacterium]